MERTNQHIGSSLDDLLSEDGTLAAISERATKRVLAWQVLQAMEHKGISKSELSERMGTSRSALDRLLDPKNSSVTLSTLEKVATALGKRLTIGLVDA